MVYAFSDKVSQEMDGTQDHIGRIIQDMVGPAVDVVLDFDDPEGDFYYLFSGTTMSLRFDTEGISVVDFNIETGEDEELESFEPTELEKAVYWLVTMAKVRNSTS